MPKPQRAPRFEHVGLRGQALGDTYHYLLGMRWIPFLLLTVLVYLAFNALFAGLFLLGGDCFAAPVPGDVLQAFAFSVQTMASLGYGAMHPTTPYAHVVSIIESLLGLLGIAMLTGLMYAKFARPNARVGFSDHALIMPMDGVPVLHFRMSNQRHNQVVGAHVEVTALLEESTAEGYFQRRLVNLELTRDRSPAFSLSWTVMHVIDEHSPFWSDDDGYTLPDNFVGLVVNFTGIDDMFAQAVHAQHYYYREHILADRRFTDMIEVRSNQLLRVHHDRLHEHEPMP
jgi:inward rectifier potassium channel